MRPKKLKRFLNKDRYCFYCGIKFTSLTPPTKDHAWPKSKKGLNDAINIVLACSICNARKGSSLPSPEHSKILLDKVSESINNLITDHNKKLGTLCDFKNMLEEHIGLSSRFPKPSSLHWEKDRE